MEELNVESFNNLIALYQVVGVFVLIASILVICYLIIKLLAWSVSCDYEIEIKRKDK